MNELEELFKLLHTKRFSQDLAKTTLSSLLETPAALIILQRLEAKNKPQGDLLRHLLERFANSQCERLCDHFYALYPLMGKHRVNLAIDYDAPPVQLFRKFMDFLLKYENVHPGDIPKLVHLTRSLLRITATDFIAESSWIADLKFNIVVTARNIRAKHETRLSQEARRRILPSEPFTLWNLSKQPYAIPWTLKRSDEIAPRVTDRTVMPFFAASSACEGADYVGLTSCPLNAEDSIWHLAGTHQCFIFRGKDKPASIYIADDDMGQIIGTAYVFPADLPAHQLSSASWRSEIPNWSKRESTFPRLTLSCSTLLELMSLVMHSSSD